MKNILFAILVLTGLALNAQKKWTLKQCVDYALENNITIQQGKNTLLSNDQNIIAAKGRFLPSVSASVGGGVNLGSGFNPVTNQRINNTVYSSNYGIGLSQTIFNGFANLNNYKQAKINREQNELELNRIKDDISLNVINAYLNILFNTEGLKTAQAQVEFSKAQLKQVEGLVDAGVQPKANIYDAQATLSRDEQAETVAQNSLDLAVLSLSQLLQLPYDGFAVEIIDVASPSAELLYNEVSPILAYAFENRNEIKVAEKSIESAVLGTKIAESGFYPSLSFGYSYGSSASFIRPRTTFTDPNTGQILTLPETPLFGQFDDNAGHNFNLSLNIPIFSRFQNKTSVAQAKINEITSKLQLEQAKISLEATIQRAFTDAKAGYKSYIAAQKSLEAQKFAFDNAKERYDIGAFNAFDLEQSRIAYLNAQASLINAKYDFVFRNKVLDFYLGKPLIN